MYVKDPQKLKEYLLALPIPVELSLFLLQVLQVVLSPIPGEVVQTVGGFLLGKFWGLIFNIIGIAIGSSIAFYLGRVLGQPFLIRFISQDKIEAFKSKINSDKGFLSLLIIFIIPGAPKDTLCYICGITPLSFIRFILVTTLGRLPGIVFTTVLGSQFAEGDYRGLIILIAVLVLGGIIYLIFRKRLHKHLID